MRLAILGTLALVTALAALAVVAPSSRVHAQSPTSTNPEGTLSQVVAAMNRGDVAELESFFPEDAIITGFPDCALACVGRADVRMELTAIVDAHVHITTSDVQVSGDTVTCRFVATSDILEGLHIDRVLGTFTLQVRSGGITSATFALDPNDPQTAQVIALYGGPPKQEAATPSAASSQPTPVQATPASLALPLAGSTPSATSDRNWLLLSAILVAVGAVCVGGALVGRWSVRRDGLL